MFLFLLIILLLVIVTKSHKNKNRPNSNAQKMNSICNRFVPHQSLTHPPSFMKICPQLFDNLANRQTNRERD